MFGAMDPWDGDVVHKQPDENVEFVLLYETFEVVKR